MRKHCALWLARGAACVNLERDVFDRIYGQMERLLPFCPEDRRLIHGNFGYGNVLARDPLPSRVTVSPAATPSEKGESPVPPFARDLFFPSHHRTDYYGISIMGFFIRHPETGADVGQFPHLFPASIAIGNGLTQMAPGSLDSLQLVVADGALESVT